MSEDRQQHEIDHDVENDAVIGKAFRGSLILLAVLIALGGGLWGWKNRAPVKVEEQITEISVPDISKFIYPSFKRFSKYSFASCP